MVVGTGLGALDRYVPALPSNRSRYPLPSLALPPRDSSGEELLLPARLRAGVATGLGRTFGGLALGSLAFLALALFDDGLLLDLERGAWTLATISSGSVNRVTSEGISRSRT